MTEKKQERYDKAYIRMALEWAKLSHCNRKKVGAIIVKNKMIISIVHVKCLHLFYTLQHPLLSKNLLHLYPYIHLYTPIY